MSTPLVLNGFWKVAVVEVNISSNLSKTESIYLNSSICEESIVEGEKQPLLRRVMSVDTGNWNTIYQLPHYVPVKTNEIFDIDVYRTNSRNEFASFINHDTTVTLHFKAFPFVV